MTTEAYSPYLQTGIGYVRFYASKKWVGRKLTLNAKNGEHADCEILNPPFYDQEKAIPRVKIVQNWP